MMGALFWSIFGRSNAANAPRANVEIERMAAKQLAEIAASSHWGADLASVSDAIRANTPQSVVKDTARNTSSCVPRLNDVASR